MRWVVLSMLPWMIPSQHPIGELAALAAASRLQAVIADLAAQQHTRVLSYRLRVTRSKQALQRGDYRVLTLLGTGLMGQLAAALGEGGEP